MKYLVIVILTALVTFGMVCSIFFGGENLPIGEQIHFQNQDGNFTYVAIPSKGKGHDALETAFAQYVQQSGRKEDQLYRTTSINYLKVSKWGQYKMMPEWQYEYLPKRKR